MFMAPAKYRRRTAPRSWAHGNQRQGKRQKNERRPVAMLNDYHLQFLRLLNERGARFLVIGGQARFAYHGIATKDLDIWVDISSENRPALEECLVEWKIEHPLHTLGDFSRPLALRPEVQIKFPDADAWFMRRDGEPAEILVQDGIDVLTSIGETDFKSYYERATTMVIDGLKIPFLAADDIEAISPPIPRQGAQVDG